MSLSWRTLDEKRNETDICSGCGTIELSGIVMGLVGRLVGVEEEFLDKSVVIEEKSQKGFDDEKFLNSFLGIDWKKSDATKTQIKGLETALDLYRLHNSRYPSTKQGLISLLKKPNTGKNVESWNGPYLRGKKYLKMDGIMIFFMRVVLMVKIKKLFL